MDKKDWQGGVIPAGQTRAFAAWRLPSFDASAANVVQTGTPEDEATKKSATAKAVDADKPVPTGAQVPEAEAEVSISEVQLEEVNPVTLEEVEAIRQEAYNEGFAVGEKDGFVAGQLRAREEAEAALKPRLDALEALMENLFEPIARQDQELEQVMLDLVKQISKAVIQRELKLHSSQIRQVLSEALKLIPLEGQQVRIYVNPEDFYSIKALRERHEENWRILEDENLLPGGCKVETSNSQIDASVETRLKTLMQQLLEQQRHLQSNPADTDLLQEFDLTVVAIDSPEGEAQPAAPVEPLPFADPLNLPDTDADDAADAGVVWR